MADAPRRTSGGISRPAALQMGRGPSRSESHSEPRHWRARNSVSQTSAFQILQVILPFFAFWPGELPALRMGLLEPPRTQRTRRERANAYNETLCVPSRPLRFREAWFVSATNMTNAGADRLDIFRLEFFCLDRLVPAVAPTKSFVVPFLRLRLLERRTTTAFGAMRFNCQSDRGWSERSREICGKTGSPESLLPRGATCFSRAGLAQILPVLQLGNP